MSARRSRRPVVESSNSEESDDDRPVPRVRPSSQRMSENDSQRDDLNLSVCIPAYEDDDEENETGDDNSEFLEDMSVLNPTEKRRKVNEMIEQCQELEEMTGFQDGENKLIRTQVEQSVLLFETQFLYNNDVSERSKSRSRSRSQEIMDTEMDSSTSTSSRHVQMTPRTAKKCDSTRADSSNSRRRRNSSGGQTTLSQNQASMIVADAKPSDMFLSYKHTEMCARVLRKRSQMIGVEESTISLDAYLNGLKDMAKTETVSGELDVDAMAFRLHQLTATAWKTAAGLPVRLGAFDHTEFLATENQNVKKEVKVQAAKPRRVNRFDPDSLIATQEEVTITQEARQAKLRANDEVTKKFQHSLGDFCRANGSAPADLFEFTLNKESVRESLNNAFNVAFGVRDGSIALTRDNGQIKVTPSKPTVKSDESSTNREQYIVSVSAATIKKMQAIAHGETVLKASKKS